MTPNPVLNILVSINVGVLSIFFSLAVALYAIYLSRKIESEAKIIKNIDSLIIKSSFSKREFISEISPRKDKVISPLNELDIVINDYLIDHSVEPLGKLKDYDLDSQAFVISKFKSISNKTFQLYPFFKESDKEKNLSIDNKEKLSNSFYNRLMEIERLTKELRACIDGNQIIHTNMKEVFKKHENPISKLIYDVVNENIKKSESAIENSLHDIKREHYYLKSLNQSIKKIPYLNTVGLFFIYQFAFGIVTPLLWSSAFFLEHEKSIFLGYLISFISLFPYALGIGYVFHKVTRHTNDTPNS